MHRDDVVKRIDGETQAILDDMNKSVALTKEQVIKDLLNMVVEDVKPELHRNLRVG